MNNPLAIFDFDRTIADTFSPSPAGIDVEKAYDIAVTQTFGDKGYEIYQNELGGLQNREPKELVEELIKTTQGKDVPIPPHQLQESTQQLVDAKLDIMLDTISPDWPPLLPGAKEFFSSALQDEFPVDIGILSSGHDRFINRVFEANDLPRPQFLVTSDTIRDRLKPNRPKCKPYTYGLAVIHQAAQKKTLQEPHEDQEGTFLQREQSKSQMIYIGDDPKKDGGLAENARILFGFVPFVEPDFVPDETRGQILIQDFTVLHELFTTNYSEIKDGESFAQIFLEREDAEVFPPLSSTERPYQRWLENVRETGRKEAF